MKLTSQASQELRKVLEHAKLAANHLYEHHVLGRTATDEEVIELEGLRDKLCYEYLAQLDRLIGAQRRKINQTTVAK